MDEKTTEFVVAYRSNKRSGAVPNLRRGKHMDSGSLLPVCGKRCLGPTWCARQTSCVQLLQVVLNFPIPGDTTRVQLSTLATGCNEKYRVCVTCRLHERQAAPTAFLPSRTPPPTRAPEAHRSPTTLSPRHHRPHRHRYPLPPAAAGRAPRSR